MKKRLVPLLIVACVAAEEQAPLPDLVATSSAIDGVKAGRELVASPSPQPAATICTEFNSYMPSECHCVDASKSAQMTCQVSIDGYLTFGARFVIDICGTPDIAFYYDAGDGYQLAEQFGLPYTDDIPIPGVSASVPFLGTIGAQAEITFSGTISDITVNFAIGACMGSTCDKQLDIIGDFLPYSLLKISGIDLSAVVDNICQ